MYYEHKQKADRNRGLLFVSRSFGRARKADPENTPVGCFPAVAFPQKSEPYKRRHIGATILHPNTKVLDFQGLFVFLVVKTPFFTIAPFLTGSVTIAEVGFTSCRSLFYTEKEIFLLRL